MGIMDIFGGGVGAGQSSTPFANAAAAPTVGGSRGYSPFMDPSRQGSLGGLIGSLTGAPTLGQSQTAGAARSIAGLAKLVESGVPIPQAINQFIQTPEGMEAFSSTEGFAALEGYIKTQMATGYAANTQFRDAAGGTMGDPVPGADEQERQALLAGATAGDPPELKAAKSQALYQASIMSAMYGDPTQTEKATKRLFDLGQIDEITMELINAGTMTVTSDPVHGGYLISDISGVRPTLFFDAEGGMALGPQLTAAHAQTQLPQNQIGGQAQPPAFQSATPAGQGAPGPLAAIQPPASFDPGSGYFGIDPEAGPTIDVINTAGIANSAEGILSGWWGQVDPKYAGQDVASRDAIAGLINFDMMAGVGSGERQSTYIQKKIDALSAKGIGDNPIAYATKLLELRKSFESQAKMAMAELRKPRLSQKTRDGLQEDIQNFRRSLQNVPPIPVLEAAIASADVGQGAIPAAIQRATDLYQDAETRGADALAGALEGAGAPQVGPAVGTIEEGHVFLGGDPGDRANWEPVR